VVCRDERLGRDRGTPTESVRWDLRLLVRNVIASRGLTEGGCVELHVVAAKWTGLARGSRRASRGTTEGHGEEGRSGSDGRTSSTAHAGAQRRVGGASFREGGESVGRNVPAPLAERAERPGSSALTAAVRSDPLRRTVSRTSRHNSMQANWCPCRSTYVPLETALEPVGTPLNHILRLFPSRITVELVEQIGPREGHGGHGVSGRGGGFGCG
jgi:hypothetical protein